MKKLLSKLDTEKLRELNLKKAALFAVPCLLILALALVLSINPKKPAPPVETPPAVTSVPVATAAPSSTPSAAPIAEKKDETVKTVLKLSPGEETLQISVNNEKGKAVTGTEFELKLTYPDKTEQNFKTGTDGKLFRSGLKSGEYTVTMLEKDGFETAASQKCTVKAKVQYAPISAEKKQPEVKPVTQLPENEVDPGHGGSTPTDIEIVVTPESGDTVETGGGLVVIDDSEQPPVIEEDESGSLVVNETRPVLDANGNPCYVYDYVTGENGFLLLSESGEESDVMPVEENGKLAYGMRRVITVLRSDENGITEVPDGIIPEEPEEGVEYITEESAQRVEIMDTAGVPFSAYMITATPAVETVSTPVGWQTENGKMCYYTQQGKKLTGLKKVDGKLYYFDDSGAKASSLGVDVSYFNGEIDWSRVKAQGIDFAVIRVAGRTWGSGILFEDSNSYKQMENGGKYLQEAKAAGLKVGVYVYSAAITTDEAVEEANLALDILDGVGLDLPVYIDMEYSGDYPNGRADKLTSQQRADIVKSFCSTVRQGGYTPGVYAGEYYLENGALDQSQISDYSLWLASYTENQTLPSFSGYNMWQFTSGGSVDGISGLVDLNVIF